MVRRALLTRGGHVEIADLQGHNSAEEIRCRSSPPHLPESLAAYVSTLPTLASSLHVGPLPGMQDILQRVFPTQLYDSHCPLAS